ncbi:MAG: hypothetical protein GY833_21770 [Aestuariibacter sp.]|nr:hypothetical protein [Aestuariibacter sp.]|tara:strand:+ start:105312 stop:105593 length:282 start_codon:yes stop_codon:yes gene_type:complete
MDNKISYSALDDSLKKAAELIQRYFNDETLTALSFEEKKMTLTVACRVHAADSDHLGRQHLDALSLLKSANIEYLLNSMEPQTIIKSEADNEH